MRYIITGCAGFIGYHTAKQLLSEENEVYGIDNLNDFYDVQLKLRRLEELKQYNNFRFDCLDITKSFRHLENYDAFIHLAALANVRMSIGRPDEYYKTNVLGTLYLLEWAKRIGIGKFIFASSSSVYSNDNPLPFVETANTDRPLCPYAASKKAAEGLCYTYHFVHGMDISVLRLFTVYGPYGRPDMSVFKFIQNIVEGRPLKLFGDGRKERDYTYISDIVNGILLARRKMGYQIINLGFGNPVRINKVIGIIEEQSRKKAIIEYGNTHPSDMDITWANRDKAQRLLKWTPRVNIDEGIAGTLEWYFQNREWASAIKT